MKKMDQYIKSMNKAIRHIIRSALMTSLTDFTMLNAILKISRFQKIARKRRQSYLTKGTHVPPFIILSITKTCNLSCRGCYMKAQNRTETKELTIPEWKKTIHEIKEMGIGFVIIAGGEPLTKPDFFTITEKIREVIFPVFTNGILMDDNMINMFFRQKHVIPVISVEGQKPQTDWRRGEGVFESTCILFSKLRHKNIFFGASLTVNKLNFEIVTDKSYIKTLIDSGCRVFFFLEYVAVESGSEDLVLTEEQCEHLAAFAAELRRLFKGIFIAFPGDEKEFDGCLASGKGFVHINSSGDLEPCPLAPYSDTNLRETGLQKALDSRFLASIRANHEVLNEDRGGCALWVKRDIVEDLLHESKKKRA